jgi:protein-S-isoprenylcysteine O-methyltransferase Ste14
MTDPTSTFITGCWVAWGVYWLIMAFTTKRTVEREGVISYRLVAAILIIGLLAGAHLLNVSTDTQLWHTSTALGVLTDLIVLAGLAFTVWARITLGRNWSSEVTFKEGHELVQSGPYALARHPIYTGLLLMGLGTAVNYGRLIGFLVLVTVCGALLWKVRQEERIMSRHFPSAYADYRTRVHAIIPFVF